MCAVARVDFSLTHRPSVARLEEAVRESSPQFADILLNDYSDVRWITLIAAARGCRIREARDPVCGAVEI
jgi:hypothetical protein